jgi:hypothetical protein
MIRKLFVNEPEQRLVQRPGNAPIQPFAGRNVKPGWDPEM